MRVRRHIAVLATTISALALGACGGDDGDDDAGGSEPLKIGTSLPLTGDLSEPGQEAERGYELWRDTVNDGGGVLDRQVELAVRDDGSDQNTIVSDYNELIGQEDVDLLLGTFSSFLSLPAGSVAERNQMVFPSPAGGSPEIFERGYEFYFFTQQAAADQQGDAFARFVAELPESERPETAAYISLDDPFTEPVVASLRGNLEAAGIETVYNELYPQGTREFDSVANQIGQNPPDVIVHGATALQDGAGLIRSLVRTDINPDLMFQTAAPSLGDQFADAIGSENTEGIFFGTSYHPTLETEANAEFVERYDQEYGGEPTEDAADAFAAAQVLAAAAEGVGEVDNPQMATYLHENTVETILGPLSWDEVGQPQEEYLLAQWQDGEIEIALPEELATTDTIVRPKPEWAD